MTTLTTMQSLDDLVKTAGGAMNAVRGHKYNWTAAIRNPPNIVPQIPHEFSTWEREGLAYREGVALIDQSHHMTGVFVSGPDAIEFLSRLAANRITGAGNAAKQIICCNEEGWLIADGILCKVDEGVYSIYGAPFVPNWVTYQAGRTDLDVQTSMDWRSPVYGNGFANTRPDCRYQIQGPKAAALIEKLNGGPIGDVKFFHQTEIRIAGHVVKALRHGMAGAMGLELWAPWDLREEIRGTIIEAGEEFGVVPVGSAGYLVTAVESGWYQGALAAIYTGKGMDDYRKWLPFDGDEGQMRVSGSFASDRIEDFYYSPYDLGYGNFINFDHEFVGRDALRAMDRADARKKVTLLWNPDDAAALFREMLLPEGDPVRFLHLPTMNDKYECNYDSVIKDGRLAGFAGNPAYVTGERSLLSLALVDQSVEVGDEVILEWGEAGGGWGRNVVAATRRFQIRARVSPAPYSRVARENYREGSQLLTA